MVGSFIRKADVVAIGIAIILMGGCAKKEIPTSGSNRDSAPCDIFQAVLSDGELTSNTGGYLKDVKNLMLVWDGATQTQKDCRDIAAAFTLTKSSRLEVKPGDKYVVADKMYFDEDAAFVELLLLPSGMHGDFFLRKKDEWRVVQRSMWETK